MPHCQQHCSSGCQDPDPVACVQHTHAPWSAGKASQSRAVLVVPWVCQWTGELLRGRALLNDILRTDETHFGMASYSASQNRCSSALAIHWQLLELEQYKAYVPAGFNALQRVPVCASAKGLRTQPAAICCPAVVTCPQLDVPTVVLQQSKVQIVEHAGCPVVLCLQYMQRYKSSKAPTVGIAGAMLATP